MFLSFIFALFHWLDSSPEWVGPWVLFPNNKQERAELIPEDICIFYLLFTSAFYNKTKCKVDWKRFWSFIWKMTMRVYCISGTSGKSSNIKICLCKDFKCSLYVGDMGLYVQSSHHFVVWWQKNCASINVKFKLLKGRCWIKWESRLRWTEKTKKNQRSQYNMDSACGWEDWQLVSGKTLSSTSSNRIGKMWMSVQIF